MKTLEPVKERPDDYRRLELELYRLFSIEILAPLLEVLREPETVRNSLEDLVAAIARGRITYQLGRFKGKFSAKLSYELRQLGATWEPKSASYRLPQSQLPPDLKIAVVSAESRFDRVVERLNQRLEGILPDKVADAFRGHKLFDTAVFKVDRRLRGTLKGITVSPDLTKAGKEKIAEEYTNNMRLWISDFTEKQISSLRKKIQEAAFAGNRYDAIRKVISTSRDVSMGKARFLARQETSILMAKFKKARYTEVGLDSYVWGVVNGSPEHPVRPSHKKLEGKIFRWDDPPVTTAPGEPERRNNPGEDYNCRCFARPIVRF